MKQLNNIPLYIRKLIRDIYGGSCAYCGQRERLHIHHIDKDRTNNSPSNLIQLCNICHGKMHPEKFRQVAFWRKRK